VAQAAGEEGLRPRVTLRLTGALAVLCLIKGEKPGSRGR
jgi:hypothetical protein